MANCFSRVEFVKRSEGKNACLKSSYISRSCVEFQGTKFQESQIFNFSHKETPIYTEIYLPEHASQELKDREKLWNLCETFENRKNSQPAFEMVLALPDDKIITLEDRKHLLKTFVHKHFIQEGFAAEVAIHQPHGEGKKDHNWHAHVLVTGRRIAESGDTLEPTKPREFFARLSNTKWYLPWTQHQNEYFESKGLSLRVDPIGVVPEKHLGPIRMRGQAMSLIVENESLKELNQLTCTDPKIVLEKIVETKSVFDPQDVDRFLHKNVAPENVSQVRQAFWKQAEIVELLDQKTAKRTHKYTTKEVIKEEEQILRIADRIESQDTISSNLKSIQPPANLSQEQQRAFSAIIAGNRLVCIDGHAGSGKSYLLTALKDHYHSQNLTIRAMGPDNATTKVLESKGFTETRNVHKFLFALQSGKIKPSRSQEVWIVDESSKIGNRPLLEFLKFAEKYKAQVILSGSANQLGSVSRGGFFEIFCDRYGSQTLKEIQRQSTQIHRNIALDFAEGKTTNALITLSQNNGIHCSATKQDSFTDLIKEWADDARLFPTSSRLILARSNADVKVLNEMAREMRRQRGELGDKEYLCDTSLGKVYVSQGDLIEFRANDDKLDIINGTVGTLTTLSDTRFTVSIEDAKGKQRTVSFNPEIFSSYQLAYASTVFRSQGETVNRAYVAYSPGFNQKELYVAMTRHAKDVKLFVDIERTGSLSRMKYNLSRQQKEYTTLDFTTQDKLQEQAQQEEKNKKITELSTSDQFTDRMKGRGLSLLGNIKDGFGNVFERFSDTRPNKKFFNPEFPEPKNGSVTEVSRENAASPQGTHLNYLDIPTLSSEKPTPSGENNNQVEPKLYKNHSSTGTKVLQEPSGSQKPETSLFTQYQDACNHALNLKLIAEAESERQGKPLEQLPQFKEWQKACGERNAKAYDYLSANSHDSLIEKLGEKRTKILKDQVEKHLVYLDKSQHPPITKQEIQDKLFDNIDALLYRLYPEGPSQKKGSSLRFGAKGSLCVTLSGSKQGTWYNFEESKGGGLVELIAERNNLNNKDAHEWAKDFLKISHEIQVPKTHQNKKYTQSKETNWVPIKPPNGISEDGNAALPSYLKDYEEKARHAYRDKNGDLLFYVLRLVDKEDPSSKVTPPLTYGHWKGSSYNKWGLGHFTSENRPLYNLHQLYQSPTKEVLIVEGEKAADAAKEHFPDHICITWSGGCGAVSKTDWSPLAGREVLIWPDNDKAGFKAADAITSELRKQGVKKLQVVQQQQLENFPEKWDLADELPKDVTKQKIKDISLMSKSKAIDPRRVLVEIMAPNSDDFLEQAKANQVLQRVYDRMEGELLAKHKGRENLVQLDILSESARVFKAKGAIQERISQELGIKGQLAENICEQALLKSAETGTSVSKDFLEKVRDTIRESKWIDPLQKDLEKLGYDKKTQELAISKSITHAIESPKTSEKEIKDHAISFANSIKENCSLQQEIQKQLSRSVDKSHSLEI